MWREGPFFVAFGRPLSAGKAILFYLVWFLIVVVLGAVLGGVAGGILGGMGRPMEDIIAMSLLLGAVLAVVSCAGLAIALLAARRLWHRPLPLVLAFAAVAGALLGGALLGLIPVAIMTTLQPDDGAGSAPPEVKTF